MKRRPERRAIFSPRGYRRGATTRGTDQFSWDKWDKRFAADSSGSSLKGQRQSVRFPACRSFLSNHWPIASADPRGDGSPRALITKADCSVLDSTCRLGRCQGASGDKRLCQGRALVVLSGQIAMRWRYAPLVDRNTRTNGVSGGSLTLSQLKVASTGSVVPARQKTRLVPALEGTQRLARSGKPRRVVSDDRAPAPFQEGAQDGADRF